MSRRPLMIARLGALLLLTQTACLQLDPFVHNARHCSVIDDTTCTQEPNSWDRLCTPCDEPYDWSEHIDWHDGFFEGDQSVRSIDMFNQMTLPTTDGEGELDLYFIPSHGEDAARAQITIAYEHGNYANIEHYRPRIRLLHELGYNVLVWDYRGYGKSLPDTTPTPDQFLADAHQIRELVDELAPDPERVIVYGVSLGAVPAVEMALHRSPCALVLEVPFTSIEQITETNTGASLGGGMLTQGEYENRDKIKGYKGPLMVFIASEDDLFPQESIEELYENAPGPKEKHLVVGAHHGLEDGPPEILGMTAYDALLSSFLTRSGCH